MEYTIFNMSRFFINVIIAASILAALVLAGGLVWANTSFARSQPVEKDFLVPWLGARTFLQYGENPYGETATQTAQVVYYGQVAAKGEDPLTLWLPFPAELFYFPFALSTDYGLARGLWMTFQEIALAGLAILCLRLIEWRPSRLLLPVVLLISVLSVYGMITLLSGSASAFIALALAGFLLTLRNGQEEVAGGLFLLAAMAPGLTGLLAFFLLWWVFYRRRWRVLWGALMVLGLLLALSFLLLPNWFLPFVRGWISHLGHAQAFSSVRIFSTWSPVAGLRLGWALAGLILLLLCVEWGATMRDDPRHVIWTTCLTVTAMPLMGVAMQLANYVVLFIPLMVLAGVLVGRRQTARSGAGAGSFLVGVFLGLWLLTVLLFILHATTALAQVLFLLFPGLTIPGLYWVRWRFTRRPEPELYP